MHLFNARCIPFAKWHLLKFDWSVLFWKDSTNKQCSVSFIWNSAHRGDSCVWWPLSLIWIGLVWDAYLWWCQARGPILQQVKIANATAGSVRQAMANPIHSMISPRKFAPETYSNMPPERENKYYDAITCDFFYLRMEVHFCLHFGNERTLVTCKSCEGRLLKDLHATSQCPFISQCKKCTSILIFLLSDKYM